MSKQPDVDEDGVPALFCCMRFVNAAMYLSMDKTLDMVKRSPQRKNNVSLVQMLSPGNQSELKLYGTIAMKKLGKIDKGEDLYLKYGGE